jgi:hypothetical protein
MQKHKDGCHRGAANPDGVFAVKVRCDQSHVQPERAARNSGKRAVALSIEKA